MFERSCHMVPCSAFKVVLNSHEEISDDDRGMTMKFSL